VATKKRRPGSNDNPDSLVGELVDISRWAGARPDLIQAGGGNTSVKSADSRSMYLKASGYALADLLPPGEPAGPRGYVAMDVAELLRLLDREDLMEGAAGDVDTRLRTAFAAACTWVPAPGVRPSVEALLHALLGRVVIHTHPPLITALVAAQETSSAVDQFGELLGRDVLYLPYRDPGLERARELRDALRQRKAGTEKAGVLLLENHGLFVWASTPRGAKGLTTRCLRAAGEIVGTPGKARTRHTVGPEVPRQELLRLLPLVRGAAFQVSGHRMFVGFEPSPALAALCRTDAGRKSLTAGPLTPDEIVYCHSLPAVIDGTELAGDDRRVRARLTRLFTRYQRRHGFPPKMLVAVSGGYFVMAATQSGFQATADMARAALEAKLLALGLGGPRPMRPANQAFIENWEAEAYRRRIAGGRADSLPLAPRVAIVTGAGSGLGRGIARGLAKAGAAVVLADIDEPSALELKAEILSESPAAQPLVVGTDVTDEVAVARLFEEVVLGFGGVDILVNAAGIAPSCPLVEFPLADWQRTLTLNLTGYFLCAREAARWMVRQGAGGNIINLSSKTGLDASKDNSAYNATKAGEIHLARGWAKELAPHGIRVNALAPGNVFQGSGIWSPEYVRACARKRGIKPEEVIPYYINLTALKTEIKPEDVADAVIFLCSERARVITGQTLVPDAGQVFVR